MGWEEVAEPEFVSKGQFLKISQVFPRVGTKFVGIFKAESESNPNFENAEKKRDYTFLTEQGLACLTVQGRLRGQLEAAVLKDGNLVMIQFAKEIPTRHGNPARSFRVAVDRVFKGPPPKNGPNVVVPVYQPQSVPEPGSDLDADIPF
jgi:hypothetical protein